MAMVIYVYGVVKHALVGVASVVDTILLCMVSIKLVHYIALAMILLVYPPPISVYVCNMARVME